MRRIVLKAVSLFAAVALVIGCDKGQATIPTKLDQPIPSVAPPAGGGGEVPAKNKAGGKNKNASPPGTKVD